MSPTVPPDVRPPSNPHGRDGRFGFTVLKSPRPLASHPTPAPASGLDSTGVFRGLGQTNRGTCLPRTLRVSLLPDGVLECPTPLSFPSDMSTLGYGSDPKDYRRVLDTARPRPRVPWGRTHVVRVSITEGFTFISGPGPVNRLYGTGGGRNRSPCFGSGRPSKIYVVL